MMIVPLILIAIPKLPELNQFPRGISDFMYSHGITTFLMGVAIALLGMLSSRTAEKRALSTVLFIVNLMTVVTYWMLLFRLTPAFQDINGYPVDVARFLKWIATCPSLIQLVSNITRETDDRKINRIVHFDYALKIFGFLGAISPEPLSQLFLMGAIGCFTIVIGGIWEMFTDAINGKTTCKMHTTALKVSRFTTIASWTGCNLFHIIIHLS